MTMSSASQLSFSGQEFRQIMGHYPTGVCAITSVLGSSPIAMIVGSFTSVSLDPPLVGFFPGRDSTTWPKIAEAGQFCVKVLAGHQKAVCRTLSSKATDKFAGLPHRLSDSGMPILDDVVGWIDCDLETVRDAGDHYLVLGRVKFLAIESTHPPLLFHRGAYSAITTSL